MERPDILWIVTTQWRGQALGCAGDPNARTPCLDALASQGIHYTQAVTPHPFGPFARAAMLTGVPSPENGVREYFDPLPVLRDDGLATRDQGLGTEGQGLGTRDQRPGTGEQGRAPRSCSQVREGTARSRSQLREATTRWRSQLREATTRWRSQLRGEVGGRGPPRLGWTIAHELGELGYATAFFGKWHLAKRDPNVPLVGDAHARTIVPPEGRGGFEFWEGFEGGFLLNDPWLHGSRLAEPVRFKGYQSDVVCERAAEWLRGEAPSSKRQAPEKIPNAKSQTPKNSSSSKLPTTKIPNSELLPSDSDSRSTPSPVTDAPNSATGTQNPEPKTQNRAASRPWFAVVSLEAPHPPYDAPVPRPDSGQAGGVVPRDLREIVLPANVPRGGEVEARARRELAGYYAHIEATDRAIGRLIAEVDAHAAECGRRVPIVVVTSVHGDMHGAHGLFRKGWPYEESVRVPLLLRLPARQQRQAHASEIGDRRWKIGEGGERRTEGGGRSSELVSLLDLPQWTLAWANGEELQTPNPRLKTEMRGISMPSVVRLPHQCDRVWRGVRTATRKLVLDEDGSPWLFFDLEQDPLELRNLAGDASRAAEMAELAALVGPGIGA